MALGSHLRSGILFGLVCIALVLLVAQAFLWQVFFVNTRSMENTLLRGDDILMWRLPKQEFKRFDLVVYRIPGGEEKMLKRIVGLPGDHLRMTNRELFINGLAAKEPYLHQPSKLPPDNYRDNIPPKKPYTLIKLPKYQATVREMLEKSMVNDELIVPDDKYFVLGDFRDFSMDSRYTGFIPAENIVGKPKFIYLSIEMKTDDEEGSKPAHVRWDRCFRKIPQPE